MTVLSEVRPTLVLNVGYAEDHIDYFRPFRTQDNANFLAGGFGTCPTLFRPPFGSYDRTTRQAAADCGMTALVRWTAAVDDGGVQFQSGVEVTAGDIVLMRFRDSFADDHLAFLNRARQDGPPRHSPRAHPTKPWAGFERSGQCGPTRPIR
ncbi:MAG: polysaccharide deacetylase family protein [Umezawaea sp.]